jgi:hypothetical protein
MTLEFHQRPHSPGPPFPGPLTPAPFLEWGAEGALRPPYAILPAPWRPGPDLVARFLDKPTGDFIKLNPYPLALSAAEARGLRAAVAQRARTLQRLWKDIMLDGGRGADALGLTPYLSTIFRDEGVDFDEMRRLWAGQSPDQIRFAAGPDVMRLGPMRWVAIEDNLGRLGSMSEAHALSAAFRRLTGLPLDGFGREEDYPLAVRAFLDRVARERGLAPSSLQAAAVASNSPHSRHKTELDLENARKVDGIRAAGLEPWFFETVTAAQRAVLADGTLDALVNTDIRAWRPRAELHDAFARGVAFFEAPGVKALANKGFLPWIDDACRLFLGEEPLLPTVPSRLLTHMADVENAPDLDAMVLKRGREFGGKGIVMPEERQADPDGTMAMVRRWFDDDGALVGQQRTFPSRMPGPDGAHVVEWRPFAYALGFDDIMPALNVAARSRHAGGDPRCHVTRGALCVPVLNGGDV